MNRLLLIDGNSMMNRAFYGLPLLSNKEGLYTNGILGFINIMNRIIKEEHITHMIVAFDLKGPTFRHDLYEAYKGTRKGMPEELRPQMALIKEILADMQVTICTLESYEADDVLGTLSLQGEASGYEVILLSGDRDMLQLATEHVTIVIPQKRKGVTSYIRYKADDVVQLYGVTPKEFIDVKGLMGDSSDNIPGIPGVGEKTALKLISKYHTIEAAYKERDSFAKGLCGKMEEYYEQALMSRHLARIVLECPIEVEFDACVIENLYTPKVFERFVELELNSLLGHFDETPSIETKLIYETVTVDDLIPMKMQFIRGVKCFYHLFYEKDFLGIGYSFEDETISYYTDSSLIPLEALTQVILELIQDETTEKVTFNYKEQLHYLSAKLDFKLTKMEDLSLMLYLINPVTGYYDISQIGQDYLGINFPMNDIFYGKGKGKKSYTELNKEKIIEREIKALNILKNGYPKILESLTENNLIKLYHTIELPLLHTLYHVEMRGIKVDKEALITYGNKLEKRLKVLEATIHELAGESFNIASPKQLGTIIFDKLGLPHGKKTKTGYSTAVSVLEKVAPYHPIIKEIMLYRQLSKLKSTYADGLLGMIQEDGRIHTTFKQKVTSTGRLSSVEPNLQNIPIKMVIGREIRKVFIPQKGYLFIDADYSQIELRLLAHLSEDPSFIKAFREELDIHRMTASQVFHTPFEEVSQQQRSNAKAVNFGIVYGISAFSLSDDLQVDFKEAEDYIHQYFTKYPKVKSFLDASVETAKKKGYVTTMYHRIRPIPELSSKNFHQRSFGERIAMNTPIQGSAADIIKIAMIRVEERLLKEKLESRLVLQVHDELIIEALESEKARVQKILIEEMEQVASLKVPLTVDAHIGANWYEAK